MFFNEENHSNELGRQSLVTQHEDIHKDMQELQIIGLPVGNRGRMASEVSLIINVFLFHQTSILQFLVNQIIGKIMDFKKLLHETCSVQLSQRKLSLLEDFEDTLDISIQFFGLEWKSVLGRWTYIGTKVRCED